MKKALLILAIILCSAQLYSAEPLVKFYLQDGSTKQYNLSEIDSLNVIDKKNNYVMRIHYQDTLIAYYPTEIIVSIKFEKDSATRDILNVYIFSYPKSYILSTIDSVVFYIDKYQPLTIGSQVWMLKNLNVDHYRNGDSIPEIRDSIKWYNTFDGACCFYNNDSTIDRIYGKLYNWFAVIDPRGLAPDGWHVPTDTEWAGLETCLGWYRVAGGKLKSRGTIEAGDGLWLSPNQGATNESGFSAHPGGYRYLNGTYDDYRYFGNWWSSTVSGMAFAWFWRLGYRGTNVSRDYLNKQSGCSVRCIKDN